jgi:hypothetical protein
MLSGDRLKFKCVVPVMAFVLLPVAVDNLIVVGVIAILSIMSPSTTIKFRNSKYCKSTVTAKLVRYIGAAGRQIYTRSWKAESIKAEVDVKIEGRERSDTVRPGTGGQERPSLWRTGSIKQVIEGKAVRGTGYIIHILGSYTAYGKKVGRGANVLIVYWHWVHEDPLLMRTGSIEQMIEWKAALVRNEGNTSLLGDRAIPINVKIELSVKESDREVEGGTGSIEQVVEEKAASVRVVGLTSHSGAVNISVSVKMEPSGKEGDQEVEMNRIQHGATPGELLRPCMHVITVNRCPKYIMCDDKCALFDLCPSNKPIMCVNRYSNTLYTTMCAILRNATYTATMCVNRYSRNATYTATMCVKRYSNTLYMIMCVIPRNTVYINRSTVKGYSTVTNRAESCDYYVLYNPVDRRYMYMHKVTRVYTCNTVQTGLYGGCIGSNRHGRYGE